MCNRIEVAKIACPDFEKKAQREYSAITYASFRVCLCEVEQVFVALHRDR